MKTNWDELGFAIGSIPKGPYSGEQGGTSFAKAALDQILGDEWNGLNQPFGMPLARALAVSCLQHLQSKKAVLYSYSIYKNSKDKESQADAVWLIKHLAVKESYPWVEEFLNDPNTIHWGLGLLDQLFRRSIIDYETEKDSNEMLFALALKNSNDTLLEKIEFIRDYLSHRQ